MEQPAQKTALYPFDGKFVLIAGGTNDLGLLVTSRFVEMGAKVVATYLSEAERHAFSSRYPDMVNDIYFDWVDAVDPAKVTKCVNHHIKQRGAPAALVNLVGGYAYGPSVLSSDSHEFQRMLDINFHSTFNFCSAVVPAMVEAGGGKVVNIGCRGGQYGAPMSAAYSIAKSAVVRFSEALSHEVKEKGVNVNSVLPSILDTPSTRQDMPDQDFSRWVDPVDLAEVILFLASDASRALHGAAIPVYGRV